MPRAQKRFGRRLTKAPAVQRNRKKQDGRPKGTLKRYRFDQTRLGFMLRYEVPVVYDVLMKLLPFSFWPEPPFEVVKAVCEASGDPSLKKAKFYRHLEEYRRTGLYCRRPKKLTPERREYYQRIRAKKLALYVKQNRSRIEAARKSEVFRNVLDTPPQKRRDK